jgi:formylmethanofuran dehydrogenase subunit C
MITLTLKRESNIPLDGDVITPDTFHDKTNAKIKSTLIVWGNKKLPLGEFFNVDGEKSSSITVIGNCDKVKLIGHKMSFGSILIKGNAGYNTGSYMTGGTLEIGGNTRDYLGAMMEGGQIICNGNTGHFLGGAYKGESSGMEGGEIIVHGNAGHEVGGFMRRGLIVVGGNCGDFPGIFMLAGTVVIIGQSGDRAGANMVRGTVVLMKDAPILPSFYENSLLRSPAIDVLLNRISRFGINANPGQTFRRFNGDVNQIGKGEILVCTSKQN